MDTLYANSVEISSLDEIFDNCCNTTDENTPVSYFLVQQNDDYSTVKQGYENVSIRGYQKQPKLDSCFTYKVFTSTKKNLLDDTITIMSWGPMNEYPVKIEKNNSIML